MADKLELLPEVASKYEMLGGFGVGEYHWHGRVLLEQITVEQADRLVAAGFPYLVVKEVKGERLKVKGKETIEPDAVVEEKNDMTNGEPEITSND